MLLVMLMRLTYVFMLRLTTSPYLFVAFVLIICTYTPHPTVSAVYMMHVYAHTPTALTDCVLEQ